MNNIFLFTGEESYLIHEQISGWKKAFITKHGDINLATLDAGEIPINDIVLQAEAMPFLGDKRLIFVHGLPDAPKTRNAGKVSKKDEKREGDLEKLEKALGDLPETTVIVFVQSKPDKRKSFYKKLTKKAEVKEFKQLQGYDLNTWIQKTVKQKGGKISSSDTEYLISLAGQDLWKLFHEIEKITSYTGEKAIDKKTISHLVIPTLEANIFHFTDALGAKNYKRAIQDLHKILAAGDSLSQVFYMIVRQFRLLLQISGYIESNPSAGSATIAAALKIHPFVARNTMTQAKNFKLAELKKAYQNLLDIDVALKTSKIRITTENQEELALAIEQFILGFCC